MKISYGDASLKYEKRLYLLEVKLLCTFVLFVKMMVKEDVRLPCHIRKGFNFISLKAQLSKKALGNLLLHCPQLRKVNLSAWNISREDFEKIMEKLYHDNLNITLIGPK